MKLNKIIGMISLLGGKWTSYRLMGEETVDTVVNYLKGELS